jgi:hypothetical protein
VARPIRRNLYREIRDKRSARYIPGRPAGMTKEQLRRIAEQAFKSNVPIKKVDRQQ